MITPGPAHLLAGSILAGLQVITGAVTFGGALDGQVGGGIVIILAAIQAGLAYYLNHATTPTGEVVAVESPGEHPTAGPAADFPEGTPVKVTKAKS